jgi:hypothetical protein
MAFVWPSLALFSAFFVAAAFDGAYFHSYRFRLSEHAESRTEHALHTARAVLMPATIALLFTPGGAALACAAVLIGLDLVVGLLDVVVERWSRERFGGLPHGEYMTHLIATVFHVGAEALAIAGRLSGPAAPLDPRANALVLAVVIGSSLAAIQHIVLLARGFRSPASEAVR